MISAMLLFILVLFSSINLISSTTYTCDRSISCGCSAVTTVVTSRIIGGEAASNYAWGWIVSLQQSGHHICGASLLTSEYAVTAAHCVIQVINNVSILSILAGTNYLDDVSNTTIQRRTIIKTIIHPNYDPSTDTNDIAILQFSSLIISSNSKIAFICLPKQNQDPFQTNTNLVAIGWGVTVQNSHIPSNYLQQVTVQAISPTSQTCLQSGITNLTVQFCAGTITGGKDTCQGDSGGPLMAFVSNSWILAGITSAGEGCAQAQYPGIYTRVSAFVSFINSSVNFSIIETPTLTTQQNYNQTNNKGNREDIIVKSNFMFWFSFLMFFLFFY